MNSGLETNVFRVSGTPIHVCVCVSVYLLHLGQLSACVLIIPQVLLVPNQDDGNIGTEVLHLRCPLLRNVFCPRRERSRRRCELKTEVMRDRLCRVMMQNSLLMMDCSTDCSGQKCFSCTNPVSHQVHYGIYTRAHTHTYSFESTNIIILHPNSMFLSLKR